jgi:hypothetical protein
MYALVVWSIFWHPAAPPTISLLLFLLLLVNNLLIFYHAATKYLHSCLLKKYLYSLKSSFKNPTETKNLYRARKRSTFCTPPGFEPVTSGKCT